MGARESSAELEAGIHDDHVVSKIALVAALSTCEQSLVRDKAMKMLKEKAAFRTQPREIGWFRRKIEHHMVDDAEKDAFRMMQRAGTFCQKLFQEPQRDKRDAGEVHSWEEMGTKGPNKRQCPENAREELFSIQEVRDKFERVANDKNYRLVKAVLKRLGTTVCMQDKEKHPWKWYINMFSKSCMPLEDIRKMADMPLFKQPAPVADTVLKPEEPVGQVDVHSGLDGHEKDSL